MIVLVFAREGIVDEAVVFVESEQEIEEGRLEAEEMLDGRTPVFIIGQAEVDEKWPVLNDFSRMRAYIG